MAPDCRFCCLREELRLNVTHPGPWGAQGLAGQSGRGTLPRGRGLEPGSEGGAGMGMVVGGQSSQPWEVRIWNLEWLH